MTRNNSGLSNVTTIHRMNSGTGVPGTREAEWTSTQDQRKSRGAYLAARNGNISENTSGSSTGAGQEPSLLKHQGSFTTMTGMS